jgi:hypothetical protein
VFCANCGTELTKDDLYCFECGKKNDFLSNSHNNHFGTTIDATNRFKSEQSSKQFFSSKPVLVKTMIVGNITRKSGSSSVIRGVVGETLLGPIGLVGGLLSGKNRNKTTFLLIYSNGARKTITVKTNGTEFNYFVKFLSE